jgi:hypothetical protein
VTTSKAQAQVDPATACFQAVLASFSGRDNILDIGQVLAAFGIQHTVIEPLSDLGHNPSVVAAIICSHIYSNE